MLILEDLSANFIQNIAIIVTNQQMLNKCDLSQYVAILFPPYDFARHQPKLNPTL